MAGSVQSVESPGSYWFISITLPEWTMRSDRDWSRPIAVSLHDLSAGNDGWPCYRLGRSAMRPMNSEAMMALNSRALALARLVEMSLTQPLRVATCRDDVEWNGNTFVGGK